MADPSSHPIVYVFTNLDTHIVFSFSVNGTVADLKREIMLQHPVNFPKVGEIKIHAVKIKRKGVFYCLADNNVYLKKTFHWVKGSGNHWYIYLDASTLLEHSEELHPDPTSDNMVARRRQISENSSCNIEVDSSERTEDGKKLSSVSKSMKLEEILRSSSSYKKLKLSQPEYNSDGQPIDFVPDSEANP